jgi:hypothetical protein
MKQLPSFLVRYYFFRKENIKGRWWLLVNV